MKEGDYVIPSTSYLWEYFPKGPRKVLSIDDYGGPDGNKVKVKGLKKVVFWSNYLRVLK